MNGNITKEGIRADSSLPKPPTTTGTFQNIGNGESKKEYYADAAVVAYRVPENDIPIAELKPKVTSSGGKFDLTSLSDGDLAKTTFLPADLTNGKSWIQFEFAKPEIIQSVTMVADDRRDNSRALEYNLQVRLVVQKTGDQALRKEPG